MKATTIFFFATVVLSTLLLECYAAPSQTENKFMENVKNFAAGAKEAFDKIGDNVKNIAEDIKDKATQDIETVKSRLIKGFGNAIATLKNAFKDVKQDAEEACIKLTEQADEDFNELKKFTDDIEDYTKEEVAELLGKIEAAFDKIKEKIVEIYQAKKEDKEKLLACLDEAVQDFKACLVDLQELAKTQYNELQKGLYEKINAILNKIDSLLSNVRKFLASSNEDCKIPEHVKQNLMYKLDDTENIVAGIEECLTEAIPNYSGSKKLDIVKVKFLVKAGLTALIVFHKLVRAGIKAGKAIDLRLVADSITIAIEAIKGPVSEIGKKLKNIPELLNIYQNGVSKARSNAQYGIKVLKTTADELDAKCSA